jgi:hypothetical protein
MKQLFFAWLTINLEITHEDCAAVILSIVRSRLIGDLYRVNRA